MFILYSLFFFASKDLLLKCNNASTAYTCVAKIASVLYATLIDVVASFYGTILLH